MTTQATILVQSLGWALLHSLWQVLLIYCSLRIVLKLSGNTSARVKYHFSMAALAGSFGWFVNTCYAQWQKMQGVTIQVTQIGIEPATNKTYTLTTLPSSTVYNNVTLNSIIKYIEPSFPVLVALYIAGIAFLLMRLVVNLMQVRGLSNKGLSVTDAQWNEWLQQWQGKLEITRKVRLYFSERINVPVTIGALKPIVLLPIACMNNLSTEQVEAILLHELAHIKRHDYLLNILQTLVETVLFFNPFVWLISRIIRKEREHCCDDVVITYLNTPLHYAKALATLETHRMNNELALAATGNKHQLLNRIKRIMEMKKKPTNYTQVGIAALVIACLLISIAWFSPSIAQTKKVVTKDKKGNTTKVTSTSKKNKKGDVVVSRSVIIEKSNKDNTDGVHPDDVGNEEHIGKLIKEAMDEVDWNSIGNTANVAIAGMNWDQVGKDIAVAVNGADQNKMCKEVTVALDGIDWMDISKEIAKAGKELKEVDWNEVQVKIDEAMNDPQIKKELKLAMADARNASANARVHVINARADMEDARREMEKERKNARNSSSYSYSYSSGDYDKMLDDMQEDGLLNRDKSFSVKKAKGELYINGRKQPASVLEKYNDYIGDADEVNIQGSKGNLNVNVNTNR